MTCTSSPLTTTEPFSLRVNAAISQCLRTCCSAVVEVVGLIQRQDLALVGEQDVHVLLRQLEELVAEPRDAERVGQRERHLDAGLVRLDCRVAHRLLGARLIPEIALEIHHLRRGDVVHVDVLGTRAASWRRGTSAWSAAHRASRRSGCAPSAARRRAAWCRRSRRPRGCRA